MTYYAIIKLYDSKGINKDFEINGMAAEKALAKAIAFLGVKGGNSILILLRKDFDELGMKMFGK